MCDTFIRVSISTEHNCVLDLLLKQQQQKVKALTLSVNNQRRELQGGYEEIKVHSFPHVFLCKMTDHHHALQSSSVTTPSPTGTNNNVIQEKQIPENQQSLELSQLNPNYQLYSSPKVSNSSATGIQRRSTVLQEHGPIIAQPVQSPSLLVLCGLLAGIAQAGVFNPYDRALYLSIRDNRPFLHVSNWYNPYTGFLQSIGGRAIQGGLYFPLEHYFLHTLNHTSRSSNSGKNKDGDPLLNFLAGTAAGAVNALLLNPISAVKYKTWGRDVNNGILHEVVGMIRKSGFSIRPFYNGVIPTILRDVVFGGTYTWLRLQIPVWFTNIPSNGNQQQQQWMANFIAAGLATILSGPFNYVRTIQFATRSHEIAPRTITILRDLFKDTMLHSTSSVQRFYYLQNKLRIGWGTARVAIGMTFAHAVYNKLHDWIDAMNRNHDDTNSTTAKSYNYR